MFKVEVHFDFHFKVQMQAWGPAKYRYISNKLHGLTLRKDTLFTDDNGKISHVLDREWRRKFYYSLGSGCGLDHLPPSKADVQGRVSYTCTLLRSFMVGSTENFTFNFTFSLSSGIVIGFRNNKS